MKFFRLVNFISYISVINLTTEWISYQLRENKRTIHKALQFSARITTPTAFNIGIVFRQQY